MMTKDNQMIVSLALIALLMIAMKVPSLERSHDDADEQIYLNLTHNLLNTGHYSLKGTGVMQNLSPDIYDKPLFHHPPLFIFQSLPLVAFFPDNTAVVASWSGHFLFMIGLMLLLMNFLGRDHWNIIIMVLTLAALDPLMMFTSQKIWLDAPLAGFGTLAVALFFKALRTDPPRRRHFLLLFSGLVMGCAILIKVPAVILFAVLLPAFLNTHRPGEKRVVAEYALWFLLPVVMVCAPWFFKFYGYYGMLIPDWLAPDQWMMNNNGFIHMVMNRPFYYFVKEMFLLTPVFLIPAYFLATRRSKAGPEAWLMGVWFLVVIGVFTCLAVFSGHSYQMRFITMACAPGYVLLAMALKGLKVFSNPALFALVLFGLVINSLTTSFYLFDPSYADVYSIFEVVRDAF